MSFKPKFHPRFGILLGIALLFLSACQDRSAQDFLVLNQTLELALESMQFDSEDALSSLKRRVAKEGNSLEGMTAIRRAEVLRSRTAKIISEINMLKNHFQQQMGGLDTSSGLPKNPRTSLSRLKGISEELAGILKAYVDNLNDTSADLGIRFSYIGADEPKEFYQQQFQGRSAGAVLARLSQIQIEAIRYEQEILKKLGAGDSSND